jgi:peptidyl-tRNA hydrolase
VQFAAQNEEGLAVHDELDGSAFLFEVRRGGGLRGKYGGLKTSGQQKN